MDPTPTSATSPASAFVRGLTLVCGDTDAQSRPAQSTGAQSRAALPGAICIDAGASAVSPYSDGAVDSIVVLGGLDGADDVIQTLRAWRRVLKDGGTLVLVWSGQQDEVRPRLSAACVLSLVHLVGGFESVSHAGSPNRGADATLVLARRKVAEVRAPFAVLGATMAAAASTSLTCRVELLFQFGTMLLQCGEATLARACFERVLAHEPSSAEGHFGLGMAYGAERRWKDALCELECARRLDPDNVELRRWLELARGHVSAPAVVLPSTPAKWSPAPAPPRADAGACVPL